MPVFLSDEWFATADKLATEAGDLKLPPAQANAKLNLIITDAPEGQVEMSIMNGKMSKGASADALTTLTLDAITMRKVFLEVDIMAAMQAFMTGQVKVQGDMVQLMALQTSLPSAEQRALFNRILEQTT